MKRWLLRIGFVIGGPLLVLLLIEGIWQLIGDPRIAEKQAWLAKVAPHSRLGELGMMVVDEEAEVSYRLKPGFEETVDGQTYRINSHGMRGPEVEKQRQEGVKRILVIGDSYAFGYGVDEPATISAQLQARLRPRQPGIEVLNMGVPAYQTGQEARLLEREGIAFDPDLVVLVYYGNDNITQTLIYDPRFKIIHFDEMPFSYGMKHVLSRSILYSRVCKGYTQYLTKSGALDFHGLLHWPTTRTRIRKIVKICADAQVKFLLVALPTLSSSRPLFNPNSAITKAHRRVLILAADDGIPVIDMRATFMARNVPVEDLFLKATEPRRDTHLNQEGLRILVDQVVAAIESNKVF